MSDVELVTSGDDAATEVAVTIAALVTAQAGALVRDVTARGLRLAEVAVVAIAGYPPTFAATWAALAEVELSHAVLLTEERMVLVIVASRAALTGLLLDRGVDQEALDGAYAAGAHATVLVVGTRETLLLVTAKWPPEVAGAQAKRASLRLVKP